MKTIEETFGIGCNLHQVVFAMLEMDEDVVVDENGETIDDWDAILGLGKGEMV